MFDFNGKYVVVTGGSRGIGAAVARRFYDDGAAGIAVISTKDEIAWVNKLDPSGSRIMTLGLDVSSRSEVEAAFKKIYERFGRIDFLINNAGIIKDGMFHKMSDENWDRVIDIDLNGIFHCTKQVINAMRDQGFGRIVMMSSISAYGNVGQANYASAKGAIISLTKSLARESARKGITVNAILPAAVETDMLATIPKGAGGDSPDAGMPMGKPEDVASLTAYLCSDEAWFINGALIDINGGRH